eukprot:gene9684-20131_t
MCTTAGNPGLYGISRLNYPEDFLKLGEEAISRSDNLRNSIAKSHAFQYPKETLLALDRVSNEICSVIDAAELCRNTHTDEEFRNAAELAFSQLSSYIHELNIDKSLYNKLIEIKNHPQYPNNLQEEDILFMNDLRNEFESDGIHINDPEDILKLTHIKDTLVELESQYMRNISNDNSLFEIGPINNSQYNQIKNWLNNIVPQNSSSTSRSVVCTSNKNICNPLLRSVEQNDIRKQIWFGTNNEPKRPNKFEGSAHFTIQCGCTNSIGTNINLPEFPNINTAINNINQDNISYNNDINQGNANNTAVDTTSTTSSNGRQLPVIALVFGFSPRSDTSGCGKSSLLSFQE